MSDNGYRVEDLKFPDYIEIKSTGTIAPTKEEDDDIEWSNNKLYLRV
jgi:hypothetical protein